MIDLLVVADDFTGALDTGVQFAGQGVGTVVSLGDSPDFEGCEPGIRVMVVDAETRHLPAGEAAAQVVRIVKLARRHGVKWFYKKTDSALRGNIGAELAAMLQASGEDRLYFAPAFPKAGRTTEKGIQYDRGVPIAESAFGKDPFEPVTCSYVPEIIALQAEVPVHCTPPAGPARDGGAGIYVLDGKTDDDLQASFQLIRDTGAAVMAGCAGLAAWLPGLWPREPAPAPSLPSFRGIAVVSGSVNPITLAQLRRATEAGYSRFRPTPAQKLDPGFEDSAGFEALCGSISQAFQATGHVVVETVNADRPNRDYLSPDDAGLELARKTISGNMGKIAARLCRSLDAVFVVVGGDTLLAAMAALGAGRVLPVRELAPGVVLSRVPLEDRTLHVVTKSGGFGEEDFLLQLQSMLEEAAGK